MVLSYYVTVEYQGRTYEHTPHLSSFLFHVTFLDIYSKNCTSKHEFLIFDNLNFVIKELGHFGIGQKKKMEFGNEVQIRRSPHFS